MPNWAHLHVMFNHVPIVGIPLVTLVLAIGLLRKSQEVLRISLVLSLLLGAGTYAVKFVGEEAEEVVEDLAWANKDRIHDHEELAEKATIAALLGAAVAAFTLWRARGGKTVDSRFAGGTLVIMLVASVVLGLTAFEGGEIRHDEFGGAVPGAEVEERDER